MRTTSAEKLPLSLFRQQQAQPQAFASAEQLQLLKRVKKQFRKDVSSFCIT